RPGAQMGALARRRSFSASLCRFAACGRTLDARASRRGERPQSPAGAVRVIGVFEHVARSLLAALDPEGAHRLTIATLKFAPLPQVGEDDRRLGVRAFGLNFRNPVGMAAGFDKNAEVADALLRLGFGFAEVGTITPQPQPGNPRPRVFRLEADAGVINRLGFNSQGADR